MESGIYSICFCGRPVSGRVLRRRSNWDRTYCSCLDRNYDCGAHSHFFGREHALGDYRVHGDYAVLVVLSGIPKCLSKREGVPQSSWLKSCIWRVVYRSVYWMGFYIASDRVLGAARTLTVFS